jgi:hypothetical protein
MRTVNESLTKTLDNLREPPAWVKGLSNLPKDGKKRKWDAKKRKWVEVT